MSKEEIFQELKEIMFDLCASEDVTEESNLYDDLQLDSLDVVEIIMESEKRFEISIKDEDILDSPLHQLTAGKLANVIECAISLKTIKSNKESCKIY
jgi:acyl carrier protein